MAALTALRFDGVELVDHATDAFGRLHRQGVVTVLDMGLIEWSRNRPRPKTRHGVSSIGLARMDGSFWGMLFGLTFFTPMMSPSRGTSGDTLSDLGIGSIFIREMRDKIKAGSAALFILSATAIPDDVIEALSKPRPDIISTILPPAGENRLRELFAQGSPTPSG